jgi:hypothetical protein
MLDTYRAHTFRYLPKKRIRSQQQAIDFVNERGFIFFWPIKDIDLPSLWGAVAGNRPVPNDHDDPGHITWQWKDALLGKKKWYYARILRRRNTIISLKLINSFYALSPNYGDPDQDILDQYEQGKLRNQEKQIYETLLEEGPLNTLLLRKMSGLSAASQVSSFNLSLDNLQRDFRILPTGISQAGAWHYSFVYDLTHRFFPNLVHDAKTVDQHSARKTILEDYLRSVGFCSKKDVQKLFGWTGIEIENAMKRLISEDKVYFPVFLEGEAKEYYTIRQIY